MTTPTSKPFANAAPRSRHAALKAAFTGAFVAALTAGFVFHTQLGPAPADRAAEQALVASR